MTANISMNTPQYVNVEPNAKEALVPRAVPTCEEIGFRAIKKGDFKLGRQMLKSALSQWQDSTMELDHLIELTVAVADTYLNEGQNYNAKVWYIKALNHCSAQKGCFLNEAAIKARLAEVCVLDSKNAEAQQYFEEAQNLYLRAIDKDANSLLGVLIDLSWVLTVHGKADEIKQVNSLIAQIKHLQYEEHRGIEAA